ncbi:collagen alpha-1(I) chain-like [Macrobrachium nipponense]|uniref:collagen alpha-1(I) chain-like n=1 Tax=Macrobrachium nipponense TaxID=159736 RepID=UPI0030C8651A
MSGWTLGQSSAVGHHQDSVILERLAEVVGLGHDTSLRCRCEGAEIQVLGTVTNKVGVGGQRFFDDQSEVENLCKGICHLDISSMRSFSWSVKDDMRPERLPIPAEEGGRARPAKARVAAHPLSGRRKGSTGRGQCGCPSPLRQAEGLDRRRPEWLPIPSQAGGRARAAEARAAAHPLSGRRKGSTGGGQSGCPSPLRQAEEFDRRRPERLPIPTEVGRRARSAEARAAAHPHRGRRKGSTGGGQNGCPSPPRQKGSTGGGQSGCTSPTRQAEGLDRLRPRGAAHPRQGRQKDSTGGGQSGYPSPPRQAEGLDRRRPEWLPIPSQAGGRARPAEARAAAHPLSGRHKGSTGGGQSGCPFPLRQAEELDRRRPERLPIPSQAGIRARPAEARVAAHPLSGRHKGSTGGGQSGCPSPRRQAEGLDQRRPELSIPLSGRHKAPQPAGPEWAGPSPSGRHKGSDRRRPEWRPIPFRQGKRASTGEARAAAIPFSGQHKGRTGEARVAAIPLRHKPGSTRRRAEWLSSPSQAGIRDSTGGGQSGLSHPLSGKHKGSTGGGQSSCPSPSQPGIRLQPAEAKSGCPILSGAEGLDPAEPGVAVSPLRQASPRASTGEARGKAAHPLSRQQRGGSDRRRPEWLAHPPRRQNGSPLARPGAAPLPAQEGPKGSTCGGPEWLPYPLSGRHKGSTRRRPEGGCPPRRGRQKGSTGGGQSSCPSPSRQAEGLDRRRPEWLPIPIEAGRRARLAEARVAAHPRRGRQKGSTGGGQSGCPSPPRQAEGLDRRRPEQLPIPIEAGRRARPTEARVAAHPHRGRQKGSTDGGQSGCPSPSRQAEGLDWRRPEWLPIPAEAGKRTRPAEARASAHPLSGRWKSSTGGGQSGCPSPLRQAEELDRRRPERLPIPSQAGIRARPAEARVAAHPLSGRRKGSTGGGQSGCPSPLRQAEGLDQRRPEWLSIPSQAGIRAQPAEARVAVHPLSGRHKGSTGGGQSGCPFPLRQAEELDRRRPERLPIPSQAGIRARPAEARVAAHPLSGRHKGSTGGGQSGCPSPLRQAEGLDRRRPEWLSIPSQASIRARLAEARVAAHPLSGRQRGSTGGGQSGCPSPPRQAEWLDRRRPERLPIPAQAGIRARLAEDRVAAYPLSGRHKGSTGGGQSGCPSPPRQAEGLDRRRPEQLPIPIEAGRRARPTEARVAAHPHRGRQKGSTGGGQSGCPSPPRQAEGLDWRRPEWLPIPTEAGRRARPAEARVAAHPHRGRQKGSTGGGQSSCPSPSRQAEGLDRRRPEWLPIPIEAGRRARPTEARVAAHSPSRQEAARLAEARVAAHPRRGRQKDSTGRGQSAEEARPEEAEQLPIPSSGRHKGSTGGGQSGCPSPLRQAEGLDRRRPERLPIPSQAGIRALLEEARVAAYPLSGRHKGSTGGGQSGCPSPPRQAEGLDRRRPEWLPIPAEAGRSGSTGGGQSGCPSPPRQAEGLDRRRPERLPIPAEAGRRARPAEARVAAHPNRGRQKGRTGGGPSAAPFPIEAGRRARPAEARVTAHPLSGRQKGSTGGGQSGCLSPPRQAEGLDRQRPERLPIPSQAGGRARPAEARVAAHPLSGRRKSSTGGGQSGCPSPLRQA